MGNSSSPQTTTQQQNVTIPDELRQYVSGSDGIFSRANSLASFGQLSPTIGKSQATLDGQEATRSLAESLQTNLVPQAQQTFSSLLNSDLVNSTQLSDAIFASTNPIQQQLDRYGVPATQDAAVSAGQLGSSRQGIAEGLARSDANRQMGDIASQLAFGALQTDNNNKQFALNYAPQMAGLEGLAPEILSLLGQQDEAYQLNNENAESRNLSELARLLSGFMPGSNSTTTTTQNRASSGLEGIGTALSLASLFVPQVAPVAAIAKAGAQ